MRSVRIVALTALLMTGMAYGASTVTYTVEVGGDNHTTGPTGWEAGFQPTFTSGVIDSLTAHVPNPGNVTWAVRVTVDGTDFLWGYDFDVFGAANLVFDLELYYKDGAGVETLVTGFGAAPLACTTGTPGQATAKGCAPTDKGFWSSINDGDSDGIYVDILANAALATSIYQGTYPPADPNQQLRSLQDDATLTPAGPNFDYGWYPTANGRGGVDFANSKLPLNTTVSGLDGKLVGFGAGYTSFDGTSYKAGVGKNEIYAGGDTGFGADRPLFEGQINTAHLQEGTYVLKVVPSQAGTNVLHSKVNYESATPDYTGLGTFAEAADTVVAANTVSFYVDPYVQPTAVVGRHVFYNQSFYDGNKVAIDAAPVAGANNDDADAIDPSKEPLFPHQTPVLCTIANYTGYNKGLNGFIYDIASPLPGHPVQGDFTFTSLGKIPGTTDPVGTVVAPNNFVVHPGEGVGGSTRVIMTFVNGDPSLTVNQAQPAGSLVNTWVKVTISAAIGLQSNEIHYWGNVAGDTGTGNSAAYLPCTAVDEIYCRNNPHIPAPATRAPVDDVGDFNKDSGVTGVDQIYARNHVTIPGAPACATVR